MNEVCTVRDELIGELEDLRKKICEILKDIPQTS
jgi:hypothetical protein